MTRLYRNAFAFCFRSRQRPVFSGAARPRFRPTLLALEDRTLPSTLTVLNLADDGTGSLRDTIRQADSGDNIQFDPSLSGGQINLTSGELLIDKSLTVQGLGADQLTVSGTHNSGVWEIASDVTVSLSGLRIADGVASEGGGIDNHGVLVMSSCVVSGNRADQFGGGVYSYGTLTMSSCTVANNSAFDGGGLYCGGTENLADCAITGNSATDYGGGIASVETMTLTRCTLSGNTAFSNGGALLSFRQTTLINCTVAGNSTDPTHATGAGGGLYRYTGTLTVVNGTVADNSSPQGGGLANSTFPGELRLLNTLVARNTGTSGSPDVNGSITSMGHNLIGATDGSTGWVPSDLTGTAAAPLDARLGPLADNGGPTQTVALLPGSPALDAGDNTGAPDFDQRGLARIVGGTIDIGAFEVQDGTVTQLKVSAPADIPSGMPFDVTVTALDAYGHTVTDYTGTVTFVASDPAAVLPSDYTFTADDGGSHTFTGVIFYRAGAQTLTATDTLDPTLTGSAAVGVRPGEAVGFSLLAPFQVEAGAAFTLTVTAYDAHGNVATGFTGTVSFSTTDPQVNLPDHTFGAADQGIFSFDVTLLTPGLQTIVATGDTFNASLTLLVL
jgi:predicted outer membrane repeat protein